MEALNTLKNALDIARQARSVKELALAVAPDAWVTPLVLNDGPIPADAPADGAEIAQALRRLRNTLKGEFIDAGAVDYASLAGAPTYAALERVSRSLQRADPRELQGDAARIAFWINIYNVLAIHGVIALKLERSVMEVPSFFKRVSYNVGGHPLSLDQIENGVLRRNGAHPATRQRTLPKGDLRLAFCPELVDARIHVALVCTARSCPPVAFYEAERLDAQLDMAAANYVNTAVFLHPEERQIELPIIFKYYADDFGGRPGIRDFVLAHADDPQPFAKAFERGWGWRWSRYDWSLNATVG